MKFRVIKSTYEMQGTEKAFACHDSHGHTYYVPRSKVKIIEEIAPKNVYDVTTLIIEIPAWIISRNDLPIFDLDELFLER